MSKNVTVRVYMDFAKNDRYGYLFTIECGGDIQGLARIGREKILGRKGIQKTKGDARRVDAGENLWYKKNCYVAVDRVHSNITSLSHQ